MLFTYKKDFYSEGGEIKSLLTNDGSMRKAEQKT